MKKYFTIFTLILVTEMAIAIFHIHKWIRGFVGDLLVIPLLYCFVRMVSNLSVKSATILVMCIAFTSEIVQLFHLDKLLNIKQEWVIILIGNTFDIFDLLAFTLGIIPIYFIEKLRSHEEN